jgi:PHD/YefM family antitoxin component YafN of YafNO toxin-antitoxin module
LPPRRAPGNRGYYSLALAGWRRHIRDEGATISIASIPLPADAIEYVANDDARVVLTRDGQPVAAIVSLHDLRALEELDEAEDDYLSRVAAEAVAQWEAEGRPAGIPMEDIARDLDIDLTIEP